MPPGMPPGMLGAAHKPGAVPLRPLSLGDIYDAAFRIIRFNPRATVGSAVLVAAVAMAVPVVVTAVLSLLLDLSLGSAASGDPAEPTGADLLGVVGAFGALGLGSVLQSVGLVLVTGMIAHVTMAAAVGRRLSLGQAWAATRGRRWRLIGMTLLLGLMLVAVLGGYALSWLPVVAVGETWLLVVWGLVTVPLLLAFLCWFWIRVHYLPAPALMLEGVSVTGAIGRGFRLTRGAFWRTFGIALLTLVIAQVAGSMLAFPVSLATQLAVLGGAPGEAGLFLVVAGQALSTVIAAAFVTPFTATVASLQYVDLRMRREALDVELAHRAGISAP
jgi:hypothetical protein